MKRRRPKGYCGDIQHTWNIWVGTAACITLLCAFLCVIAIACVLISPDNADRVAEFNATAAEFNALPQEQRENLQGLFDSSMLNENLMLQMKPTPPTIFQIVGAFLLLTVLLIIVIAPAATFFTYRVRHLSWDFYLFDLPFDRPYGWILFLMMSPICWPFFIGSYLIMRIQTRKTTAAKAGS